MEHGEGARLPGEEGPLGRVHPGDAVLARDDVRRPRGEDREGDGAPEESLRGLPERAVAARDRDDVERGPEAPGDELRRVPRPLRGDRVETESSRGGARDHARDVDPPRGSARLRVVDEDPAPRLARGRVSQTTFPDPSPA